MGNGQHAGAAREASPYLELDRADWAGLAQTANDATEQPLTAEEIDRVRGLGDQLNLHEVQQVPAGLGSIEVLGRAAVMPGELGHGVHVRVDRVGREVPQAHVFDHALTKRGHRRLLVGDKEPMMTRAAERRGNGFNGCESGKEHQAGPAASHRAAV